MSLGVVLIHNGDPERVDSAREAVSRFSATAVNLVDIHLGEVSYQPPIKPANLRASVRAWWLSVTGDHQWLGYVSPSTSFRQWVSRLWQTADFAPKKLRKTLRRRKRVSVTRALTEKNVRAWQRMLDEGWDFLLVVEDDVVVAKKSEAEITDALLALGAQDPGQLFFGSLAQALTADQLGASGLLVEKSDTLLWFSKPVSNTAAAYVLSRELAQAFLTEVTRHRFLLAIPADWLLNRLFMRFKSRGIAISSFHARQGIFVNRSILGQLPSQTRV